MAARYDGLNPVIMTLSFFWWSAAMLQMGLLVYGKTELGLSATGTGALLCSAAVGIVAGQVIAGFIDRRVFLLGSTMFTGWVAAALLAILYFTRPGPVAFSVILGVLAFDLGLFKLPFVPRRRVSMHVENITDRVREWAKGSRLEFNAKLNEWYGGEASVFL